MSRLACACVLCLGVLGGGATPALAGLFDALARPWHIAQPMLCRDQLDILPGNNDWLYWDTILPQNNRAAGLTLHRKTVNNGLSFWAELTPQVEVAMVSNGAAPYVVRQVTLTEKQRKDIAKRVGLRREALIRAEATLRAGSVALAPVLLALAFPPSALATSLAGLLARGTAGAGAVKLIYDIIEVSDLPDRDLLAPLDVAATSVDPRRIGDLLYEGSALARVFSIVTTEGPHKWLVDRRVILGRDAQRRAVVIPVFECLIPMRWAPLD